MRISKSFLDPLRQPASVAIAFLGGVALFNSCLKLGFVEASSAVRLLNHTYVWFREFIFWPVETVIQKDISVYLKNTFVIYMVFARSFWSCISFLKNEYDTPAD